MFHRYRSTSIGNHSRHDISIVSITSNARHSEVGCHSCDDYFSDSFFFQVFFQFCFIERTYSSLRDCLLSWIIVEFFYEFGWPGSLSQYSHTRCRAKSWRDRRAVIIVVMESETDPDNLFSDRSEVIDESSDISECAIFFVEFPHSLRRDLPIWMEEFVDEIDEDECARHRCMWWGIRLSLYSPCLYIILML